MLTINTWRDPYDSGFSPTRPKEITLEPGLTTLVGCNGAGKTTLLLNIKEEMKKQNVPCHFYDNLQNGSSSIAEALFYGDTALGVSLATASEGEAIKINFGQLSTKFKRFLNDGFFDTKTNRLAEIFCDKEDAEKEVGNQRVLLFDAVDSGLSVDSIVEIKEVFDLVLKDAEELGLELYLIISANEYELARNVNCFDVNEGKYLRFADYEEYRSFIIKSRKKKEKRIEKQAVWYENKRRKAEEALAKRKAKYEPLIEEIRKKAEDEGRELTYRERNRIRDYEHRIERGD